MQSAKCKMQNAKSAAPAAHPTSNTQYPTPTDPNPSSLIGHPSDPDAPYDLVFVDPPYVLADPTLSACLAALDAGWLAPEGWTVILTRGHKSSLPAVPVHWATRRQLRYGDSLLTLYREDRWA